MKERILAILRNRKKVVSGEILSAELGISRVSVWKHIKKLRESGYSIEASTNGYRLEKSPGTPFPWEFPGRSSKIHYFPEVGSTMDIARDLARKNCTDFTVVIADRQTKGRGRLTRTWISQDGGLYFSIILRPLIPPVLSFRVNFIASLSLVKVLRKMFPVDALVKWPNDILVGDAKLCGMLSEMEAEADKISFINLGIGLNVNNTPSPKEQKATSLKKLLGKNVDRKEILATFLDEFEEGMKDVLNDNIILEWKQYSGTLNKQVKIVTLHDTLEGIAVDVDNDGALRLKLNDGSIKKVLYGDCFYHPPSKLDSALDK